MNSLLGVLCVAGVWVMYMWDACVVGGFVLWRLCVLGCGVRWGVPFGGGWGVVGMRQVSKGLFLTYLWFVMWSEPPVGGSICDVVCGAVPSSCRGGRAACLVMVLWQLSIVKVFLCSCWCACEVQHGGRVAPPLYLRQIGASCGRMWRGFNSILIVPCVQCLCDESCTCGSPWVGPLWTVLESSVCVLGGLSLYEVEP